MLLTLPSWPSSLRPWDTPGQVLVGAMMIVAAVLAASSRGRLKAVILVGVTGYGTALMFLLHGAPDLALTQILVETVTLVVFVLVLRKLPKYFTDRPLHSSRWWRLVIAIMVGFTVVSTVYLAAGARVATPVSEAFYEAAYTFGYGKNIVNVTLVDIRSWDTLGEISVLVVAATGVASLIFIRRRYTELEPPRGAGRPRRRSFRRPETADRSDNSTQGRMTWLRGTERLSPMKRSIIFEVITRLLFPVMILTSLFFLFSGHNNPGGGFAGGLIAGLALTIRYLAGGRHELDEAAPVDAGRVLGVGLLTAGLSSLAPVLVGGRIGQSFDIVINAPYLSYLPTPWGTVTLMGEIHFVTSLIFDIGVYLVVIGVMLDLARSLGSGIDQHEEEDRTPSPQAIHGPARPEGAPVALTAREGCADELEPDPDDRLRRADHRRGLPDDGAVADPDPGRRAAGRQRGQPAVPGRLRRAGGAPFIGTERGRDISDPLPQAMVLTAIVITLGLTAFLLTMAYRSFQLNGHDEVADDVEDRQIVQLAEADLASASFDEDDRSLPSEDDRDPDPAEEGSEEQRSAPTQRRAGRASGRGRGGHRRDHRTRRGRHRLVNNLLPLPVLLPLLGAGLALILGRHPRAQRAVSSSVLLIVVVVAATLVLLTDRHGPIVLWVGAWPEPLGVALVADRLSSLMLLVSSIVTFTVLVFSMGQDVEERKRETPVSIYHPTFLVLAAGVSNAFLAGDLFNLFVGFEILLFASYVLLTLGGTGERIRAGTTYVLVSVLSSLLFLIAIACHLRRLRHGQPRPAVVATAGAASRRAARAAAGPAHRVLDQGRGVPAVGLAAGLLPDGAGAGHRRVRGPAHQGRCVRDHPHPDPAVPRLARCPTC